MTMRRFPMTLKWRLIVSLGSVLLVFMAVSLYQLHESRGIKQNITNQNRQTGYQMNALNALSGLQEIQLLYNDFVKSVDPEVLTNYAERKKALASETASLADIQIKADSKKGKELQGAGKKLRDLTAELTNVFDQTVKLNQDENADPLDVINKTPEYAERFAALKKQADALIGEYSDFFKNMASEAAAKSNRRLDLSAAVGLISSLIVFCLTIAVATLLIRSFTKPMDKLRVAVRRMAEGDLRNTIDSREQDELGELSRHFDTMVVKVREMLLRSKQTAGTLTDFSGTFTRFSSSTAEAHSGMTATMSDISSGALHQAEQSEQSSVWISRLNLELEEIALATEEMLAFGRQAENSSRSGAMSVQHLKASSDRTEQAMLQVFESLRHLSGSTKQIRGITNSIGDISNQTNILALNAAIEAARAGVHGKGFSVIAEEVRALSLATKTSSEQIDEIVKQLYHDMEQFGLLMKTTGESVASQRDTVRDTLESFSAIDGSVRGLYGQISRVHERAEKAKAENIEVTRSVNGVASVAEETAAGIRQMAAVTADQNDSIRRIAGEAEEISRLSDLLLQEINRFRLDEETEPLLQPRSAAGDVGAASTKAAGRLEAASDEAGAA